ncbi:MAG: DUF2975 domain-containing protein [Bacteroides sp.]|nr:DUF2975 domain-containing protein [Bacteroides sp.]
MKRSVFILTTLMLLCLAGTILQALPYVLKGGLDSVAAGREHRDIAKVNIVPIEPVATPCQVRSVTVFPPKETSEIALMGPFALIGFIVSIYGVVFFIQLLLSLCRQEVFVRKNVRRLRAISGIMIYMVLVMGLGCYLEYSAAKDIVDVPGYALRPFTWPYRDGIRLALLLALFAEIFAYGIRLREEEELTV